MIYVIIGFLIVIFAYVDAITKDRKFSQYSSLAILIIMWLLVSLRDNVGTDWDAYYEFYKESTDSVEIGYALVNNFFSGINLPYNLFLFIINGVALTLMFFFLKRNAFFLSFGLLIFFSDLFLYYNLSAIRQGIAIAITCFSINFAIERKKTFFVISVLTAACFHTTAIAFLIVYFLPRKKLPLKTYMFFLIGFLVANVFLQSISELITLYTLKNAEFYTSQQEQVDNIVNLFYVGIIKRSVIILLIIAAREKIFNLPNIYYFFNLYLFGFAIYLSSYLISPDIGTRLSSYFTIFEIVLAGCLIYSLESLKSRVIVASVFTIMAFYKILAYTTFDTYNYHSIIKLF